MGRRLLEINSLSCSAWLMKKMPLARRMSPNTILARSSSKERWVGFHCWKGVVIPITVDLFPKITAIAGAMALFFYLLGKRSSYEKSDFLLPAHTGEPRPVCAGTIQGHKYR